MKVKLKEEKEKEKEKDTESEEKKKMDQRVKVRGKWRLGESPMPVDRPRASWIRGDLRWKTMCIRCIRGLNSDSGLRMPLLLSTISNQPPHPSHPNRENFLETSKRGSGGAA